MKIHGSVVVVTGAGAGLGLCLAREISNRQLAGLVVADIDGDSVCSAAAELAGHGVCADLSTEAGVRGVVDTAVRQFGAVDIWIANAGIGQACDPFTDD